VSFLLLVPSELEEDGGGEGGFSGGLVSQGHVVVTFGRQGQGMDGVITWCGVHSGLAF